MKAFESCSGVASRGREKSIPYDPAYMFARTMGVPLEEKGAHRLIFWLILMVERPIPDDERFIAGHLSCSVRKWRKLRHELIARHLIEVKGGRIYEEYALQILDQMAKKPARPTLSVVLRYQIFERDDYTCAYCGTTEGPFEVDHIHPVILGGSDNPENLACACKPCNRSKGAKLLADWTGARQ